MSSCRIGTIFKKIKKGGKLILYYQAQGRGKKKAINNFS